MEIFPVIRYSATSPVTLTNRAFGWDSTLITDTTWSDGDGSPVWTFAVSGTNHTMTASSGLMTFSHKIVAAIVAAKNDSNEIAMFMSGNNAHTQWNDGVLTFATTETNKNTEVGIKGNGTGYGIFEAFDEDNSAELDYYCKGGIGFIELNGDGTDLKIQNPAAGDVLLFGNSAEGETRKLELSGRRLGGARKNISLAVGSVTDSVATFDGTVTSANFNMLLSANELQVDGININGDIIKGEIAGDSVSIEFRNSRELDIYGDFSEGDRAIRIRTLENTDQITPEQLLLDTNPRGLWRFFSHSRGTGKGQPAFSFDDAGASFEGQNTIGHSVFRTDGIDKLQITHLGGIAVKLINRTGATSVVGQTVKADTANNDSYILTAAADTECIGVVLNAVSNNAAGWVVIAGPADVAMR